VPPATCWDDCAPAELPCLLVSALLLSVVCQRAVLSAALHVTLARGSPYVARPVTSWIELPHGARAHVLPSTRAHQL